MLLIFFVIMLLNLNGCKKSKFKNLISYSLLNNVQNLDPQTALEPEELTIVSNIFEGLYKKGPKNNYELGIAEKVEAKNDKKYVFTLKNNVYWRKSKNKDSKIKVTAKDFVFAFKRLIDPKTNSPFASNYFFIKNAKKINENKAPIKSLGVYANRENQLTIELEHNTPNLKELLASAPAMPCNEEFFNSTNGRYGTTRENIICNGPFFLNAWKIEKSQTKRIKIRVNDEYHIKNFVKIVGVNFSSRTPEEAFNMFKNKEINTAIVDFKQFNMLEKNQIQNMQFQNNVTGLIFNQDRQILNVDSVRIALAKAVDKTKLKNKIQSNQTIANCLIPNSITINNKPYDKLKPQEPITHKYEPDLAFNLLQKAKETEFKKNFNLNTYSVLVNNSTPAINQLLQTWQKDLKLFFKLDEQDYENYVKKLNSSQFDLALVCLDNKFNNPSSILKTFTDNSKYNYANYKTENLDRVLVAANMQSSTKDAAELYFKAEKFICQKAYFIPLTFETQYFVFRKNIKNIVFNPANKEFYYAYCICD